MYCTISLYICTRYLDDAMYYLDVQDEGIGNKRVLYSKLRRISAKDETSARIEISG